MISSLLTIVIPSKNSVFELKKTVDSLIRQTKIKGTDVIIADFKSNDGSHQYAIQASSELIRSLRISPVDIKENEHLNDLIERISTPYVMVISPGVIISDKDLIIKALNELFTNEHPLVYLKKNSPLDALICTILKRKRKVKMMFSRKETLSHLSMKNLESIDREILMDTKSLHKGIKISGFVD